VHLLDPFGAELLKTSQLGGHVVGVDVDVHPGRPLVKALDEQPEVLAGQRGPVVFGVPLEPGQRRPGRRAPEGQLPDIGQILSRAARCGWPRSNG
jgi:hypothetical protein